MRMKTCAILLSAAALCVACRPGASGQTAPKEVPATADTITAFYYPAIPSVLTKPEDRAAYLVAHYWDNVDFADTNYVHRPEVTEQAWANFIDVLRLVEPQLADSALKDVMARAGADRKCQLYMAGLADKYLYDPNSPMRNEEYYIATLDALLASPVLDDTDKIRPKARRELAQRNRVGTRALDFVYTLPSGEQGRLYGLEAEYLVLFINNPGCQACTETVTALQTLPAISRAQEEGRLKVLSLYPDEDTDYWREHLDEYPARWVRAYDKGMAITRSALYDLKAIPTLYLLDRHKTVLLKDVTPEAIDRLLAGRAE